jgi:hypothetical protein
MFIKKNICANRFRQQLALNETSLEDLEGKVDKMLKVGRCFLTQNVELNCVKYRVAAINPEFSSSYFQMTQHS